MRPVPVPDWIRTHPGIEGTAVFAAPDGDLTSTQIPPAEGFFYSSLVHGYDNQVFPMVAVVLELDEDELAAIREGHARHVLLSWHGRTMPVFVCPQVLNPDDWTH